MSGHMRGDEGQEMVEVGDKEKAFQEGDDVARQDEELQLLSSGPRSEAPLAGWEKTKAVSLLCILTAFLFADQNVMAPNLTAIAQDFGFDDEQRDSKLGGDVALAFFLVGAPVSLLIGALTDKIQRNFLFCSVILLGETPCMLTIGVSEYWQLLVLRAFTGIAIGGALPLIFSMMGDMYPVSQRALVSSFLSVSMSIGITLGQLVSGLTGPSLGWRMPFFLISAPAIVLALACFYILPEPARGSNERVLQSRFEEKGSTYRYKGRITVDKAIGIFKAPTNLLVFFQGAPGCLPWGVIIVFLNDYLAQNQGYGVEHATGILTAFNIGVTGGCFVGGFLGQTLYNRKHWYQTLLMGSTTISGIFPVLFIINVRAPFELMCFVAILGGFIAAITGPNVRTVLLNVNPPETRGSAFAVYNLMDDLGKGFGPFTAAMMISGFGRVNAFNFATIIGFFLCGSAHLIMGIWYERDEEKVERMVSQTADLDPLHGRG